MKLGKYVLQCFVSTPAGCIRDVPFIEGAYALRHRDRDGVAWPDAVQRLVREGLFSFYRDGHGECCGVRKVEPLKRALGPFAEKAWVTGQRKDQSPGTPRTFPSCRKTRRSARPTDAGEVQSAQPLDLEQVWDYIGSDVPFNALHTPQRASRLAAEPLHPAPLQPARTCRTVVGKIPRRMWPASREFVAKFITPVSDAPRFPKVWSETTAHRSWTTVIGVSRNTTNSTSVSALRPVKRTRSLRFSGRASVRALWTHDQSGPHHLRAHVVTGVMTMLATAAGIYLLERPVVLHAG